MNDPHTETSTADRLGSAAAPGSPPKRRKGEKAEGYRDRLANWQIEEAFKRKAKAKMHGVRQTRNKAWRIAQDERDQTLPDNENW